MACKVIVISVPITKQIYIYVESAEKLNNKGFAGSYEEKWRHFIGAPAGLTNLASLNWFYNESTGVLSARETSLKWEHEWNLAPELWQRTGEECWIHPQWISLELAARVTAAPRLSWVSTAFSTAPIHAVLLPKESTLPAVILNICHICWLGSVAQSRIRKRRTPPWWFITRLATHIIMKWVY